MPSERLYRISEVAEQTGVAPVTLRAWQRRYGLLKPGRSPQGYRCYDEQDISRIQQILAWLDKGVSIGQVKPLLANVSEPAPDGSQEAELQQLEKAVESLQPDKLHSALQQLMQAYPPRRCYNVLLQPMTERLGKRPEPSASMLRAFWHASLAQQTAVLLANQPATKRRVYCLSFEPFEVATPLALLAMGPGRQVVLLAGLAEPLSLPPALQHKADAGQLQLAVLGEQKLTSSQWHALERLQHQCGIEIVLHGSIAAMHGDALPKPETDHIDAKEVVHGR